jgi:hypothetical protein
MDEKQEQKPLAKKFHPNLGEVEYVGPYAPDPRYSVVRLKSGEDRTVTTEWLSDPKA